MFNFNWYEPRSQTDLVERERRLRQAQLDLDAREHKVRQRELEAAAVDAESRLAAARHYLQDLPPARGDFMGVPFESFTAEEILKIWKSVTILAPRTASPVPERSSGSDPLRAMLGRLPTSQDIGGQGPSRG